MSPSHGIPSGTAATAMPEGPTAPEAHSTLLTKNPTVPDPGSGETVARSSVAAPMEIGPSGSEKVVLVGISDAAVTGADPATRRATRAGASVRMIRRRKSTPQETVPTIGRGASWRSLSDDLDR